MLARIRAQKTVLILDTCDAGMVISAKSSPLLAGRAPLAEKTAILDTSDAGMVISAKSSPLLAAGRAPLAEKTAIDRLMRATGRVVLASATDQQMALEGYGGHGAFTYALLEGLRGKAASNNDKTITISTLSAFLNEEVPRITNGRQYPMTELRGISFPIGLAP